MGVKFACPNGHRLHVKAELVGKRGICPECGAKFVVPGESATPSGAAAPTSAPSEPVPSASPTGVPDESPSILLSTLSATSSLAPPAAPPLPLTSVAVPPAADAAWFVRTAAGEQFGPAKTEAIQAWLAEGRIDAACWIWRTGWADWRPSGEAMQYLLATGTTAPAAPPLPPNPVPSAASVVAAVPQLAFSTEPRVANVAAIPVPAVGGGAPASNAADARLRQLERRRQASKRWTILLGVVAFVVLVTLLVVLAK
jgi:hypothetical protein